MSDLRSHGGAERLLEDSWAARSRRPPRRELVSELAATLGFLAAAGALALVPGALDGFDPVVAATLVAVYAVLGQIAFPVGNGYALPTHLALVPMLVVAPAGAVPGLVAAGLLMPRLVDRARRRGTSLRVLFSLPDAWHALGPSSFLVAAGAHAGGHPSVPLLTTALLLGCVFDAGSAIVREAAARGTAPVLQLKVLARVWIADACLAPIGALAADAARAHIAGVLMVVPLAALLGILARDRNLRIEQAQERLELAERSARDLAYERLHDTLTGLANRTLLQDRVQNAVAAARRRRHSVAVVLLDVDGFKLVNDSLGHDAGDVVLRELASRLGAVARDGDTVSRLGADEFVLLCEEVRDDELPQLVRRVQEQLQRPVIVAARQVPVTCSIGVAVYAGTEDVPEASDLVRDAATAVSRARERGHGGIELSEPGQWQRALARLDLELELREAIAHDQLTVHYQPIVALPSGDLRGVEALVRWRRPTGELVPPDRFIPLAEANGLISEIGDIVLRTAVADVGRWARRGLVDKDFRLSVNVSARQLDDQRFPAAVTAALAGWDRPASRLCLEITETAVMRDPAVAERTLAALDAVGVRLALDDFGVGHSSLAQLGRSLPFTLLKLDRTFVAGMSSPRDRGIVEAVAALAGALELTAVAEGVETAQQAAELATIGFPYAQGFHFGRPVPAAEIVDLLHATSALTYQA